MNYISKQKYEIKSILNNNHYRFYIDINFYSMLSICICCYRDSSGIC